MGSLYQAFYWSEFSRDNMKSFFWSELNFAANETCYLDMCENDPCNGSGCTSTWDGVTAGFECDGDASGDLKGK